MIPSDYPPAPAERWHTGATDRGDEHTPRVVLRPEVLRYAELMELKLRRHDATRGQRWKQDDPRDLYNHMVEEARELYNAMIAADNKVLTAGLAAWLNEEAADIGNMAMMVVDAMGALLHPEARCAAAVGEAPDVE